MFISTVNLGFLTWESRGGLSSGAHLKWPFEEHSCNILFLFSFIRLFSFSIDLI